MLSNVAFITRVESILSESGLGVGAQVQIVSIDSEGSVRREVLQRQLSSKIVLFDEELGARREGSGELRRKSAREVVFFEIEVSDRLGLPLSRDRAVELILGEVNDVKRAEL